MKNISLLFVALLLFYFNAAGQSANIAPKTSSTILPSATFKSGPTTFLKFDAASYPLADMEMDMEKKHENDTLGQVELWRKTRLRAKEIAHKTHIQKVENRGAAEAVVQNGFSAGDGGNPQDNTVGISHSGYIVSSYNSNIFFHKKFGEVQKGMSLFSFFTTVNNNSSLCDPRITYDPLAKRFIVVCITCFQSGGVSMDGAHSRVLLAFSKTENPMDGWYFNYINTDVTSQGIWMDQPRVGVSNNDVFVTGNMFTDNSGYAGVYIFQINKNDGYTGNTLSWNYFDLGGSTMSVTPAQHAWGYYPTPGMYMVATESFSGSTINLVEVTNKQGASGNAIKNTFVSSSTYESGPMAEMSIGSGNMDYLIPGDARIGNAFFMNGICHYAFTAQSQSAATNDIVYGRLDVAKKSNSFFYLNTPDFHNCYGSLAFFGKDSTDDRVLLNFLQSNYSILPQQCVSVFSGKTNTFSEAIPVVKGLTSLQVFNQGNGFRWGDYTQVQRGFDTCQPMVYAVGQYTNAQHSWSAYIARISDKDKMPKVAVSYDTKMGCLPLEVNATASPSPSNATLEWSSGADSMQGTGNKRKLFFSKEGQFDVACKVTGNCGEILQKDTRVIQTLSYPLAQILGDTVIPTGGAILFQPKNEKTGTTYSWKFEGGSPDTSNRAVENVTYYKGGYFTVKLTAKNYCGKAEVIKTRYVRAWGPDIDGVKIPLGSEMEIRSNAEGFMVFNSSEPLINYQLFDATGREIQSGKTEDKVFTRIHAKAGLYYLSITTANYRTGSLLVIE